MRDKYVGDSYDFVKRFWAESLHSIAPLYGHPCFVPEEIRPNYSTLTSIPILDGNSLPEGPFGLLLDPDTGIPLPTSTKNRSSHIHLTTIVELNQKLKPAYIIVFDQSHHRKHEFDRGGQMDIKREFLLKNGLSSFYYLSHAPFFFISENDETLTAVRNCLLDFKIPADKLLPNPKV